MYCVATKILELLSIIGCIAYILQSLHQNYLKPKQLKVSRCLEKMKTQ